MVAIKIFLLILFISIAASRSFAQSFGFGCLGFLSGYGGYSFQEYNPKGLNDYIDAFNLNNKDSLSSPMSKFGKAQGYRVGLNIFRANIRGIILTTKGFYQFLSEKKSTYINNPLGSSSVIYQVEMQNWGVGIDLGTSISEALSWKVIDAAVLVNSAVFTNTKNSPGPFSTVTKYNSEQSTIGYTVGTGFILQIIDQYISLEGTAGYSAIMIEKMRSDSGKELTVSESSSVTMKNFISSGGFNAVIQLNVGFPL